MNQFSIPLPHVEEIEVLLEELIDQEALDLVVFNDDVNTFEHVIECLVAICDHNALQAEQCAYLVHYSGKCAVKSGSLEDLVPRCSALLEEGLSAEVI